MKVVLGIAATLVALLIVVAVVMFTGVYNVAANDPHNALVRWALMTTRVNAVQARASEITVPPGLDDPGRIQAGARRYAEMCVACHGGPGVKAMAFADHMMPKPPEMGHVAEFWAANEIQWILLNGFKMTGMPAWGPIEEAEELWAITAFVDAYPGVSADDYAQWTQTAGQGPATEGASAEGAGAEGASADRAAEDEAPPEAQ